MTNTEHDRAVKAANQPKRRGFHWLTEVLIYVGTAFLLISVGLVLLERHGVLVRNPNPQSRYEAPLRP